MPLNAWISALRLRTLPLAISGIASGAAISIHAGHSNAVLTSLCMATAAMLQILSNLANDYGDFSRGTDNNQRVGPERALQSGRIQPRTMLFAIWTTGILAGGLALLTIGVAFPTELWWEAIGFIGLGAAALWSAINYTMGKNPYGYAGMGDGFVGFFFGFVAVIGTSWLHTLAFQPSALGPAIGMAGFSMAVLHMNNMRDQVGDAASGKITLAVRFGMAGGKTYHLILICLGLIGWWTAIGIENVDPLNALIWLAPGTLLSIFQALGASMAKNYTSFDGWLKIMVLACLSMAMGFTGLLLYS